METHEWLSSLQSTIEGEQHPVSSLANAAAILWDALPGINWAGFYFLHDGALWLGPFHGKAACTRIMPEHGVCGTALSRDQTIVVPDVHAFPGHIACDAASRSEIVVPLHMHERAIGVLDIDSPVLDRFCEADRRLIERAAQILERHIDFAGCGFDLQL